MPLPGLPAELGFTPILEELGLDADFTDGLKGLEEGLVVDTVFGEGLLFETPNTPVPGPLDCVGATRGLSFICVGEDKSHVGDALGA